jgi:Kef-type K+ transport system membrane component KefB
MQNCFLNSIISSRSRSKYVLAGLELHLRELASHRKVSLLASIGGLMLSMTLGWGAGRIFGMSNTAALLLGLALGVTIVSISARTLMELGILCNRAGLSLLDAAVAAVLLSSLVTPPMLRVVFHRLNPDRPVQAAGEWSQK